MTPVSDLKIRRGRAEDAAALTRIAHDAKRHWGYPERWIKHWENDLTISPDYLNHHQVFIAESAAEILGFYSLVTENDRAELDHLWVAPPHIGTGVGKALFVHAMQGAAGREISDVQIIADPNAEGFYSKMGAYRIGETVSEIDGQPRTLPLMNIKPRS